MAYTHELSPSGKPSAATYRRGCRCRLCKSAHRAYQLAYRSRTVVYTERRDGTSEYHSHKGQPSNRTAYRWGCVHPTCLRMAGLYIDTNGVVRVKVTDEADEKFTTAEPVRRSQA